jgi:hypothetical protein
VVFDGAGHAHGSKWGGEKLDDQGQFPSAEAMKPYGLPDGFNLNE